MVDPIRPASPKPPAAVKIRFFLVNGGMVEWPVAQPDQFSFPLLCQNIRAVGHFLSDNVYIPGEQIACIGIDSGSGTLIRQPQGVHPAPAAKQ